MNKPQALLPLTTDHGQFEARVETGMFEQVVVSHEVHGTQ